MIDYLHFVFDANLFKLIQSFYSVKFSIIQWFSIYIKRMKTVRLWHTALSHDIKVTYFLFMFFHKLKLIILKSGLSKMYMNINNIWKCKFSKNNCNGIKYKRPSDKRLNEKFYKTSCKLNKFEVVKMR